MQKHVFFDLDSTLALIEGLDYLAEKKGYGKELSEITNQAMNGELPMHIALKTKLEIIKPTREDLLNLGNIYLNNLNLGAFETIQTLAANNFQIWMITGNFTLAAYLVADKLGIKTDHVFANTLNFGEKGEYVGFDDTQQLARNGGKAHVIRQVVKPNDITIMIGDGATDLETQDSVNLFIGYGGIVYRANIAKAANVYIKHPDLRSVLPYILNYPIISTNIL